MTILKMLKAAMMAALLITCSAPVRGGESTVPDPAYSSVEDLREEAVATAGLADPVTMVDPQETSGSGVRALAAAGVLVVLGGLAYWMIMRDRSLYRNVTTGGNKTEHTYSSSADRNVTGETRTLPPNASHGV